MPKVAEFWKWHKISIVSGERAFHMGAASANRKGAKWSWGLPQHSASPDKGGAGLWCQPNEEACRWKNSHVHCWPAGCLYNNLWCCQGEQAALSVSGC